MEVRGVFIIGGDLCVDAAIQRDGALIHTTLHQFGAQRATRSPVNIPRRSFPEEMQSPSNIKGGPRGRLNAHLSNSMRRPQQIRHSSKVPADITEAKYSGLRR